MPTVSIYVSNEDYDKFRAIDKKSEFIHNALNPGKVLPNFTPEEIALEQQMQEVSLEKEKLQTLIKGVRVNNIPKSFSARKKK